MYVCIRPIYGESDTYVWFICMSYIWVNDCVLLKYDM